MKRFFFFFLKIGNAKRLLQVSKFLFFFLIISYSRSSDAEHFSCFVFFFQLSSFFSVLKIGWDASIKSYPVFLFFFFLFFFLNMCFYEDLGERKRKKKTFISADLDHFRIRRVVLFHSVPSFFFFFFFLFFFLYQQYLLFDRKKRSQQPYFIYSELQHKTKKV